MKPGSVAIGLAALTALALAGGPPVDSHHSRVRVPQDTPVELRLKQTLSSAETQLDEKVEFEVIEDLRQEDVVVAPRGSSAWGVVTAAEPKNRMRRNGRLDVDLQALCLPDGKAAPLRAVRRGALNTASVNQGLGDSVLALPALPVLVFLFGKDVTIPKGREFTAYLSEDIEIDRSSLQRKTVGDCAPVRNVVEPWARILWSQIKDVESMETAVPHLMICRLRRWVAARLLPLMPMVA